MKKYFAMIIIALILVSFSACGSGQLASTPAGTTTTQQPQPNCDVEGHDFSKDPDVCAKCGMNYFSMRVIEKKVKNHYLILQLIKI